MIVDLDATTINNFVLPSSDLRIDVFRSGGAGGQSVNTTESGVRVTHLPTGLSVVCQDERSQHNNKAAGVKYLKSKLLQREKEKRMRKKEEEHIEREDNSFGSQVYNSYQQPEGVLAVNHSNIHHYCVIIQIRSYILHPYTMVKDHVSSLKVTHVHKVLEGDLEPFLEASLLSSSTRTEKK